MKIRIGFLDIIRAFAIFMVVATHAIEYTNTPGVSLLMLTGIFFSSIAVPIFFFVDGYLLIRGDPSSRQNFSEAIRENAFRLLLPWTLFSLLYFATRFFFEYIGYFQTNLAYSNSLQNILKALYFSEYSAQLYFLPALFIVRLFAPISSAALQLGWLASCLGLIAYMISFNTFEPTIKNFLPKTNGLDPFIHAIWGYQFYLIGILYKKHESQIDNQLTTSSVILSSITVTLIYLNTETSSKSIDMAFQISYLLLLITLIKHLNVRSEKMSLIGRNTMGIYLLHVPIIMKATSICINKLPISSEFVYILIVLISLFCSLAISILIQKTNYLRFFFGLRKIECPPNSHLVTKSSRMP